MRSGYRENADPRDRAAWDQRGVDQDAQRAQSA